MLAFNTFMFWTIGRYGTASRNYSAIHRLFLSLPFDPSPLGLRVLEQRAECVPSANHQVSLSMLWLLLLSSF
ncbi:hypothetical protein H5410_003259 [Solanum commersonii]|uniref:Uncharacterized protein n=1 Tax=Solanum commersonii TaxID=4109 RepID=A0A9J6B466_SOLCO|nr:hypothetical protein H5410_003259 [Solanum commersonii]